MKKPTKQFTVVLRYPDYFTDEYPNDTYTGWVKAVTWKQAVRKVQKRVQELYPDQINDPEDIALVAVIEGAPWIYVP